MSGGETSRSWVLATWELRSPHTATPVLGTRGGSPTRSRMATFEWRLSRRIRHCRSPTTCILSPFSTRTSLTDWLSRLMDRCKHHGPRRDVCGARGIRDWCWVPGVTGGTNAPRLIPPAEERKLIFSSLFALPSHTYHVPTRRTSPTGRLPSPPGVTARKALPTGRRAPGPAP